MTEQKPKSQLGLFFALLLISGISLKFVPWIGFPLLIYTILGLRVIYDYERGVLFTLGKFVGLLGGGLVWYAPGIQNLRKIDLRVQHIDIPGQEVMTKDNVPVRINAAVFFRIEYPDKVVLKIQDFKGLTALYSQTTLRDVIGGVTLDELLANRDEIAEEIRKIVDEITDEWGIDIVGVKLQDIELPDELKRAMARQAEAEREKRAIITKSEGEIQAAKNLVEAAKMIANVPQAMYLRVLHTLADISQDPNQKTIILLPFEILESLKKK